MLKEILRDCYLSVPAEITPELARSRAEKMKPLFQVQLLGKSVSDIDSAAGLLLDLARDIVSYDKALLYWKEDPEGPAELLSSRGIQQNSGTTSPKGASLFDLVQETERPLLVSRAVSGPIGAMMGRIGATSLLSMPIYAGEQVLGSLQLVRTTAPDFCAEDAHLLRVYALSFEPILEALSQAGRPHDFAFLDGLTGLFNRRYFDQHLEREIDRARRNNVSVSVLLVEIDQLERTRARQGLSTGDVFLQEVARRLRQVCRKSDTLARHHDGCFAVILPRTGKETLAVVAQRVWDAVKRPSVSDLASIEMSALEFNLSAAEYPEDGFSVESLMAACQQGLEKARTAPGVRYYQYPAPKTNAEDEDIFDAARMGLLREPLTEPSRFLNLFARLCLGTVPADRVSIMAREDDTLVVQVALGFEGQDEVVRTTRLPLSGHTVSAWVAQHRKPLLVTGADDLSRLPRQPRAAYKSDSFISFPLVEGDDLLGVIHFSNRSDGQPFSESDVEAFRPIAGVITKYLAMGSSFARAQEEFLQNSLFGLVDILERQVPGMENHSTEVARLVEATARGLGYGESDIKRLNVSSRLHDLGNAGFRTCVLAESRAFSPRERTLAQRHPLLGWKFLESMPIADVDREAILYHHEREDGSGYFGKRGVDIPATAKILAVADVYQALISPRPYRPAIPRAEALAYLDQQRGTLFDAKVLDAFRTAVASSN